jgi:flagellar biosynthetic protein FliQ
MSDDVLVNLLRQMLWVGMQLSLPVLGAAMVVGLVVGLLQAVTSVQEQTLAFVPKMIAIVLVYVLLGNWMIRVLVQYSGELIGGLPGFGAL